jgi:hypothetical protein
LITGCSVKEYLEKLNRTYFGFIALPLLLFPIVYLPLKDSALAFGGDRTIELIYYLAALLLYANLYFGWYLYKRELGLITKDWSWDKKLQAHKKASIILYGFGLISSLFSVALLLLTRHQLFVATYPILLLVLSFYRPTARRMKRELPLTEEELTMFKDKGENI